MELSEWQLKSLKKARKLIPSEPPAPWLNRQFACAAGVFAGGWTSDNLFVMLSSDGYSIQDPQKGVQLLFEVDDDAVFDNLRNNDLMFTLPTTGENIHVFGIRAGDGVHVVDKHDWKAKIIYPWWPDRTVIISHAPLWKDVSDYALKIMCADTGGDWLKCGFSPNGETLVVVGHAGADFFSRI